MKSWVAATGALGLAVVLLSMAAPQPSGPSAPEAPLYKPRPHWTSLPHPGQACITAWGWLGPTTYQRERRDGVGEGFEYFRRSIVDEPFRWGANLLEFYPPEMRKGFPLPWPAEDSLERPASYWGGWLNPAWPPEKQKELVSYVHSKDWLVHVFYHPNLVRRGKRADDPPSAIYAAEDAFQQEVLKAAERTWLHYSNPLAMGWESSLDGFGYEGWFRDLDGSTIASLWKCNPGTYLHSTAVMPSFTPNFSGSLMCARGRVGNACGLSDRWGHIYLPPGYLSYQADCRVKKPSTKVWDYWGGYGGGSYPDWLLKQANDFCRDRLEWSAAIWWLGEPENTLPARYRPYVYAASMDPIKAAYAWKLLSTGAGGYRDVTRRITPEAPEGFGSEYEPRFDTAFLQNNHLRLYRMAGSDRGLLLYNRDRLAHYDKHAGLRVDTLELSASLLSTARGDAAAAAAPWSIEIGKADGSAQEFRPVGRYWSYLPFEADRQPAAGFPARIGYEDEPDWPSVVELNFTAPVGSFEMEVGQLGESGEPGMIEVFLDGEIAGVYGVKADGAATVHRVPFSLTKAGRHVLSLQTLKGRGHGFDRVGIRRLKAGAVGFTFVEPGGHLALLREEVVDPGSFREVRHWRIQNDSPWLEVEIERESAGGAPLNTLIGAEGYDRISPDRGPLPARFTLRDSSGVRPELVVAVAGRGSIRDWRWRPKERLELESAAGGSERLRLRFVVPDGLYDASGVESLLEALPNQPEQMRLGPSGRAVIRNRARVPRVAVVEVLDPNGEPYFVKETGADGSPWWSYRGGQPRAGGGTSDFVKVYLAAGGEAVLQRYGFIDGVVKPGWGCQNVLQIAGEEIRPNGVTVDVTRLSPLLFAPRVEFSREIRSARVDGQPWQYFEGRCVLLPAATGRRRVEVEYGEASGPSLTRTYARVAEAVWEESSGRLRVLTRPAAGYESGLPGRRPYTMLVRHEGWTLNRVAGAERIPEAEYRVDEATRKAMRARGSILRFFPGQALLEFAR